MIKLYRMSKMMASKMRCVICGGWEANGGMPEAAVPFVKTVGIKVTVKN